LYSSELALVVTAACEDAMYIMKVYCCLQLCFVV